MKNNNNYKILVLSDLKESAKAVLESTVSLAKIIDGDIEFFHVKKPTEIIEKDNQLSAMRTINDTQVKTRKKIEKLLKNISEDYNVEIKHSFAFGNLRSEISNYIVNNKPDIIVLGKRKNKPLNFIGDNLTSFILKKHKGIILIASEKNSLSPNQTLNLGVLNTIDTLGKSEISKNLLLQAQQPFKSFKIIKKANEVNINSHSGLKENTVEYVFEDSDDAIKTLSNYLLKNNINLLCLNRTENQTKNNSELKQTNINEIINHTNVSLLLTQ